MPEADVLKALADSGGMALVLVIFIIVGARFSRYVVDKVVDMFSNHLGDLARVIKEDLVGATDRNTAAVESWMEKASQQTEATKRLHEDVRRMMEQRDGRQG